MRRRQRAGGRVAVQSAVWISAIAGGRASRTARIWAPATRKAAILCKCGCGNARNGADPAGVLLQCGWLTANETVTKPPDSKEPPGGDCWGKARLSDGCFAITAKTYYR